MYLTISPRPSADHVVVRRMDEDDPYWILPSAAVDYMQYLSQHSEQWLTWHPQKHHMRLCIQKMNTLIQNERGEEAVADMLVEPSQDNVAASNDNSVGGMAECKSDRAEGVAECKGSSEAVVAESKGDSAARDDNDETKTLLDESEDDDGTGTWIDEGEEQDNLTDEEETQTQKQKQRRQKKKDLKPVRASERKRVPKKTFEIES